MERLINGDWFFYTGECERGKKDQARKQLNLLVAKSHKKNEDLLILRLTAEIFVIIMQHRAPHLLQEQTEGH